MNISEYLMYVKEQRVVEQHYDLAVGCIYRIPLLIRQTVESEKGLLMLRKATTVLLISLLINPLLFFIRRWKQCALCDLLCLKDSA